tara:strand:- start:153 stop:401 length:249 start_codon:yes stop_codon:yes gene_type:complete
MAAAATALLKATDIDDGDGFFLPLLLVMAKPAKNIRNYEKFNSANSLHDVNSNGVFPVLLTSIFPDAGCRALSWSRPVSRSA